MQDINNRGSVVAPTVQPPQGAPVSQPTTGQKAAEFVARQVGSWRFIITQSVFLAVWVTFNVVSMANRWDPYPFILMNLMLSLQAAYTAPMILMAQNRQADHDRRVLYADYYVTASTNKKVREISEKLDRVLESVGQKPI